MSVVSSEEQEVLERFQKEILLKSKWVYDSIRDGYQLIEESSNPKNDIASEEIIRHFVSGITYAMSIVRLLNVGGARDKRNAQRRVNLIKTKWPDLPEAPQGLKKVRDSLEHFEERLDTWAFTSSSKSIVDLNVGINTAALAPFNINETELLRNIDDKGNFIFWNEKVSLKSVMEWVQELSEKIND
ncbi:MAG: hypothetical protein WBA30_14960 [Priestia megaterium]